MNSLTAEGPVTLRRRARSGVLAIVTVIAFVLAGCSGGGGGGGSTGSEVTIALPEEPRSLASWNAYSNDGHPVLRNIQEALINRDPETNELVPELALSWKQVDPTNWQFTLRQNVKFTDGSDFDADAAATSLNYVLDPKNAFPMRTFLGPDIEASAVDKYTLNVKTAAPDPILPTRLYFVTIPSAKQITEDLGSYETKPVGTGPYKLESWDRGQSIVLVPNDDWWGKDAPDAGGQATITKATYVFRPETEVRSAMVQQGEADLAPKLSKEQCDSAPKCESTPTIETVILRIDTKNPALSDLRVRQAISMAFDKEQIMNDILGGGKVVGQIVGPSAVGYADLPPYPYDPEKAKALIAEAKADGVDVTEPITVSAREGYILRANEVVQLIAERLKAIGMTGVTSETQETAAFEQQWTMGYPNIPPERTLLGLQQHGQELMDYSGSVVSYYSCEGNTSAYCDPQLEKMFASAVGTSGDARQKALADIAKYVYDRVPVVPIGQPNFNFGLAQRLDWTPRIDGFILLKEMTLNNS
ncbi:peptide ABC transporter substrate-binding protein [Mycolicibacterium agri]|uniref:Peptide ABC transporter substrate-binding protein n=1 Tax=Mycolicibacterium agri TaxID=36811 RepID=A0A7I9VVD8_MYCAG|nr:peptide ABC transporter substrate-binding protein [Mycolicibacterium agri]